MRDAGIVGIVGIDEIIVGIDDVVAVNHTALAVLGGRRAAAVVQIYTVISAIDSVADNADVVTDASVTAAPDAILLRGDGRIEHDPAVAYLHVRHGAGHDQTVAALRGIQGEVGETDIADTLQLDSGAVGDDGDILRLAGGRGDGEGVLGAQPLDGAAERNVRIGARQKLQGHRRIHAAMVQLADGIIQCDKISGGTAHRLHAGHGGDTAVSGLCDAVIRRLVVGTHAVLHRHPDQDLVFALLRGEVADEHGVHGIGRQHAGPFHVGLLHTVPGPLQGAGTQRVLGAAVHQDNLRRIFGGGQAGIGPVHKAVQCGVERHRHIGIAAHGRADRTDTAVDIFGDTAEHRAIQPAVEEAFGRNRRIHEIGVDVGGMEILRSLLPGGQIGVFAFAVSDVLVAVAVVVVGRHAAADVAGILVIDWEARIVADEVVVDHIHVHALVAVAAIEAEDLGVTAAHDGGVVHQVVAAFVQVDAEAVKCQVDDHLIVGDQAFAGGIGIEVVQVQSIHTADGVRIEETVVADLLRRAVAQIEQLHGAGGAAGGEQVVVHRVATDTLPHHTSRNEVINRIADHGDAVYMEIRGTVKRNAVVATADYIIFKPGVMGGSHPSVLNLDDRGSAARCTGGIRKQDAMADFDVVVGISEIHHIFRRTYAVHRQVGNHNVARILEQQHIACSLGVRGQHHILGLAGGGNQSQGILGTDDVHIIGKVDGLRIFTLLQHEGDIAAHAAKVQRGKSRPDRFELPVGTDRVAAVENLLAAVYRLFHQGVTGAVGLAVGTRNPYHHGVVTVTGHITAHTDGLGETLLQGAAPVIRGLLHPIDAPIHSDGSQRGEAAVLQRHPNRIALSGQRTAHRRVQSKQSRAVAVKAPFPADHKTGGGRSVVARRVLGIDGIGNLGSDHLRRDHRLPDGVAGIGLHQHGILGLRTVQRRAGHMHDRCFDGKHRAFGRLAQHIEGAGGVNGTLDIRGHELHHRRADGGNRAGKFEVVDEPAPGEIGAHRGALLDFEFELHLGIGDLRTDVKRLCLPPGIVGLRHQVALLPDGIAAVMERRAPAVIERSALVTVLGERLPGGAHIILTILHRGVIRIGHLADVREAQVGISVIAQIVNG